jgi:hypothetical protein
MQFTFGVITNNTSNLRPILDSIRAQNIPEYEILVIGGTELKGANIRHIRFKEDIKPMWITRKKNMITEKAKYDNIVYMHDYITLDKDWYKGFLEFGEDWDICMNQILMHNGRRYRDWTLFPDYMKKIFKYAANVLIPYNVDWMHEYMYISGAYWVAKKHVMEEEPLDENRIWGESEDVEWSKRVLGKYKYVMNDKSIVRFIKHKYVKFGTIHPEDIKVMESLKCD